MVYAFKGFIPVVHPTAFIHPQAAVTGNVIIGKQVYIGPGAAIRGDWGAIVIKDGCNVQENCTIHMFPGKTVTLEEAAHIGHGAIIHGAHIGRNVLIGMNSVIMDETVIEEECIVGAMSFIKGGSHFSRRSLIVGNPAEVIRPVSDEMVNWKTKGTALYQTLPAACHQSLKAVEPLREIPRDRPRQEVLYETWERIKKQSGENDDDS